MDQHSTCGASAPNPEAVRGESSDHAMVQAVLAGDVPAREALLRQLSCVASFLRVLNQRHGGPLDTHELEDAVQDTLLALWRNLDRYRGSGSLSAWALGTAKLEFRQALRKHSKRRGARAPVEAGELTSVERDPAQSTVDGETLAQALAALDPFVEATIRLKHYSGLTFEEIGRRMDCNANTVKTRYYLGLARIARTLRRSKP
jgi:RNA polymerase sigma-70 factor (ECF subfamily)